MSSSSPNSSLYWFPTLLWSSSEKVWRFPCNFFFTFVSQFLQIFKRIFAFVSHFLSSVSMGQISFALYICLRVPQTLLFVCLPVFSGLLGRFLGADLVRFPKGSVEGSPNCSTHLSPKCLFLHFLQPPTLISASGKNIAVLCGSCFALAF